MVFTGPVTRCTPDGGTVHEVPPELTDDDIAWLNAQMEAVGSRDRFERESWIKMEWIR